MLQSLLRLFNGGWALEGNPTSHSAEESFPYHIPKVMTDLLKKFGELVGRRVAETADFFLAMLPGGGCPPIVSLLIAI